MRGIGRMLACSAMLAGCGLHARPADAGGDVALFDFETGTWDGWTVDTATFGPAPVSAAAVAEWGGRAPQGMQGGYMAATATARHAVVPDGRMISRPFPITHPYLTFLLAGEVHPRVRAVLEVDGVAVRDAFGNNAYDLVRRGWDVREFRGRTGRLIVEDAAGPASLLRVDDFRLSRTPTSPAGRCRSSASRTC